MKCLTLDTQMNMAGTTQYKSFDFSSMVPFAGRLLAVNEAGLFELGDQTDTGTPIAAELVIPMGDIGSNMYKRLRALYFGMEAVDPMSVTLTADERTERTYEVPVSVEGQQRVKIPVGRDIKGRYWWMKIENTAGGAFALDSVQANVLELHGGHL